MGFGVLRLSYSDFWGITLEELVTMYQAVSKDEKDKFEADHQLTAWQTALLMNATGNFKKKIKLTDLIGEKEEKKKPDAEVTEINREEKNRKLSELKSKFSQESI